MPLPTGEDASLTVKDDGEFFIVLNSNYPPERANAFLKVRCRAGLHAPAGWECVGSADPQLGGKWGADISAPEDDTGSDITPLGLFDSQQEAIDALWEARHQALCKLPRY